MAISQECEHTHLHQVSLKRQISHPSHVRWDVVNVTNKPAHIRSEGVEGNGGYDSHRIDMFEEPNNSVLIKDNCPRSEDGTQRDKNVREKSVVVTNHPETHGGIKESGNARLNQNKQKVDNVSDESLVPAVGKFESDDWFQRNIRKQGECI